MKFDSSSGGQTFRIGSAIHNLMEIDQNYPANDQKARVAELVDAADSKSAAARREGSSPFSRTINDDWSD